MFYVLPDSMAYDLGLLAESLAVGVHAARLSRIQSSESAIFIGAGPIGLLAAVALQDRKRSSGVLYRYKSCDSLIFIDVLCQGGEKCADNNKWMICFMMI